MQWRRDRFKCDRLLRAAYEVIVDQREAKANRGELDRHAGAAALDAIVGRAGGTVIGMDRRRR